MLLPLSGWACVRFQSFSYCIVLMIPSYMVFVRIIVVVIAGSWHQNGENLLKPSMVSCVYLPSIAMHSRLCAKGNKFVVILQSKHLSVETGSSIVAIVVPRPCVIGAWDCFRLTTS